MEKIQVSNSSKDEVVPCLIKAIAAHEVAGFDADPSTSSAFGIGEDVCKAQRMHSVSISMPPSPIEALHIHNMKRVLFREDDTILGPDSCAMSTKFYSQPNPIPCAITTSTNGKPARFPSTKLRDKRFDSFKTWSGKLERQISNQDSQPQERANVPVHRYYDALEGPELDVLRDSEESILPDDKKWPFLLRFPISSFGICLGVSSQAIMWKTLASSESTKFLHVTPHMNHLIWFISLALIIIVTIVYSLKVIFYFEAVRREYYHPIRVNFFFAPWTALLFLALGVPPSITQTLHQSLWYILMIPILCLELKIYGQWMSGGQRRLSKVANPSNHLSVVGNFVGALLGASMGLKEGPIFFFAVGMAHYVVLFVTLYQRLPTNETLPKELHPVFFLFVAAPSVASMAWAKIQGSFDYGSRLAYFIAIFLYFSLAIRLNFFRGFRFSLAWWAYTFPMTGAAIATIRYSSVVDNTFTKTFTVILCIVSTLTVTALLVTTLIHGLLLRDLFPNDIAISISDRMPKTSQKWFHRRSGSSEANIEQYLKYSSSDGKDIEASVNNSAF
ncbi:hypothetical protein ACS0TY_010256 [Phlomoides rotata]